jgi:hypothetical protein
LKTQLRNLLWFILVYFEKGDEPYNYKSLNRTLLIVIGSLFFVLCLAVIYLTQNLSGYGFLIPVIVFFSIGFVCLTVGLLGSDRAVAKIWGNR